jgi:hypothetical protein
MYYRLYAFVFLCPILLSNASNCSADDAYRLAMEGRRLTPEAVLSLEDAITKNPQDIDSRTILLGYYFSNRSFSNSSREANAKSAKRKHILWLVRKAPEASVLATPYSEIDPTFDAEGYSQIKAAWLEHANIENPDLAALKGAAQFLLQNDRDVAEKLLIKGQRLDTQNPQWPKSLGQLYKLNMSRVKEPAKRKQMAEKAFRQYKLAYDASDDSNQQAMLTDMAKTALDAERIELAKKYAKEMLDASEQASWNAGNLVHHGHLILGRIALSQDELAEAKSHLLSAGKTNGSPQLNTFGPNMVLAKEFLEKGETDVVLKYFQQCKKF